MNSYFAYNINVFEILSYKFVSKNKSQYMELIILMIIYINVKTQSFAEYLNKQCI